jgi:hypothetical protein
MRDEHLNQETSDSPGSGLRRRLALGQAAYFIVTGIWPLLGMESFQRITGRKFDGWLVKTVGVLVAAIGLVLGLAGLRRSTEPEIPVLAVGSALSLAAIDVVYVKRGRISPIYLLDAVAELALVAGWLLVWRRGDVQRIRRAGSVSGEKSSQTGTPQ